jgi:hypothetical protein
MKNHKTILVSLLLILIVNSINSQNHNNVISRSRGNILRNLTRTHTYVNNVVTSQLDASVPIRWFYRGFREVYNR